ncbi:MAG: phasin family protein [Acidiferrobacterales bacterium]|nr:phasin family protein [Acidiferrobacterales bacterium]
MADSKKVSKKASKKVSRKTSKKIAKKVSTKARPKNVSKKTRKKPVKNKLSTKKAPKKVAKKVSKKKAKKLSKKVAKKATRKAKKKTNKRQAKQTDNRFEQLQDLLDGNLSGLNSEKAEALAKNIWLAGLGAYSKTFTGIAGRVDDLQGRYTTINAEGQKIFQELVDRGDSMQGDLEKAVKKGRDSLEDRVEDFKKRFGGSLSSVVDIPSRLRDAAKKIEQLSDSLKKK